MLTNILYLFLLLASVSAGLKDKKTTLEDIEQDYLSSQTKTKLSPTPSPSTPKVATPAISPTQYGFVPKKTIADYVQKNPTPSYLQVQYVQPAQYNQQQQYSQQPQYRQQPQPKDYSQYATVQQDNQQSQYRQQPQPKEYSQYATAQQYTPSVNQKYNSGSQYVVPQYYTNQQKYSPQVSTQQTDNYYAAQLPTSLQNYENVQYITDNSIASPAPQQYYQPQYVYLQQYTAPSTSVQTVVEPKGGVQYVMYVPAYVQSATTDPTQSYENIAYTANEVQDSASFQASQPSGIATPQIEQQATQYVQPKQVQYVQPTGKSARPEYIIRREPKSLLDSYIPSILQLQYYKQAQQNSVQEPAKISQTVSGKEYIKNSYRPESSSSAESSLVYRFQPTYRS